MTGKIRPNRLVHYQLISIMSCFFVLGTLSMVGISSNYIKEALHLSDTKANILPSLVYIWFLVCTVPTDIVMEKIGRKNTVLICMSVLVLSLFLPLLLETYAYMLICFILLGISNVCLQSSLYPLFSTMIEREKLAHHFTMGELVKTISAFTAPYIATFGSLYCAHFLGLGWRVLFFVYLIIAIISLLLLIFMKVDKEEIHESKADFLGSFRLLKDSFILLTFIGVMCHVGIDIGTNTVAPKLLMYKLGITLDKASFAAGLYFLARLTGGFLWTAIINKISKFHFFLISIGIILCALILLYFVSNKFMICLCICMVGFGNASLFPVFLSQSVLHLPEVKNKVSVLMIMGQFGGALFPFAMGVALDKIGMWASTSVLVIGVLYLVFYTFRFPHFQTEKQ